MDACDVNKLMGIFSIKCAWVDLYIDGIIMVIKGSDVETIKEWGTEVCIDFEKLWIAIVLESRWMVFY